MFFSMVALYNLTSNITFSVFDRFNEFPFIPNIILPQNKDQ